MSFRKFCFLFLLFLSINVVAQQPRLVLPIGHTDGINAIQFSPDEKKVVTSSFDKTAKIWDAITGNLLGNLNAHSEWVTSAQFSPEGKKVVTTSWDRSAKIWAVESGKLLLTLDGHASIVNCAQFSPDSKKIITGSSDNTSKIWDAVTGMLLSDLAGHIDGITFVQFSPDGKKVVTASEDNTAKLWDVATGRLLFDLVVHDRPVKFAHFSPDGKKILTISPNERAAKIWDAENGELLPDSYGLTELVHSAHFSHDGKKIVTTWGSSAKVWDIKTGLFLYELQESSVIRLAQFSPDSRKIITVSYDKTAKIWDAFSGSLLFELIGLSEVVGFSPDSKKIVTNSSTEYISQIWDAATGDPLINLKGSTTSVTSTNFSPDGIKIITTQGDNTVKIWKSSTGVLLANLKGHSKKINFAGYNNSGTKIITASDDGTAKVWDDSTGILLFDLTGHSSGVNVAQFSPDGKKIITTSFATIKIWDVANGKLLMDLTGHESTVRSAYFSPDSRKIVTASEDNTAKIWDANTGLMLVELAGFSSDVKTAKFSPDGKKIIAIANNSPGKIWDTQNGALLAELKGDDSYGFEFVAFNPDGDKIVTTSSDETAKIWDALTGELKIDLKGHVAKVFSAQFSLNSKKLITVSLDEAVKIWDVYSGALLATLNGHERQINSAQFSLDDKKIITSSLDNTSKVWNSENGELLYTFFAINSADYFNQIPVGYYQCTPDAAKLLHYVTKELKIISFEQLDVKYNRPDKVLEAIGSTDTALINSYRKAYEKRIKKLGIDTTAFSDGYSVPEADFANREVIEYEQKNGTLKLHLKGIDSTYQLDRFNIWVNEAPLYGQRGISIKKKNTSSIDTTITISLSQGENRIETSITNVNGTESYRMPLQVNYTPAIKQKEMTRFIGIGIDKFTDSQYDLQYSSKDIRDLAKKLKEKYKDNIIIDTLFNENVTVSNVKALKQKLQQTSVNDKVIISYSGHGMLSNDYDYYLSTYAVNFQKPEENGLAYDELENLLDSIPARKKLMLIDACHSGEVDKDERMAMQKMADSLGLTKGIILDGDSTTQTQQLGLKNSFELMQSLFVNVGKSTGATIISAAAGNQFALERGDLKNGVFTYSILEAMEKNPTMKISELKKIVGERVEQLTNGMQKPTSRNETIAVDWTF